MKVVIIGGVAGGASAAARLRRLDENADITLLERGPDVSFANCGLPYYIGGEIQDRARLSLQTPQSLSELLNVNVRAKTEATAIDRQKKEVVVRDVDSGTESRLPYDKLVLAPGASPLRPPLAGIDHEAIVTLRNLQDMDRIKERAASLKEVVIVGAGFIGLEMAEQLAKPGVTVHLVELVDQVLPQLDPEMAAPVALELQERGVDLRLGDGIDHFEAEGARPVAVLKSGAKLAADLVLLSIGVRPESGLAKDAGLDLGPRGHVKVNERLQTSDADIYAAGDVVESVDRLTGDPSALPLGGPANRQGRAIADHIVFGDQARTYPGNVGTAIVRVFDIAAGVTGWTEKRLQGAKRDYQTATVTDHQHAGYYPGALPLTVKILWDPADGKLLGGQAVGIDGVDKRLDVLATALAGGLGIDDLAQLELAYAPPFGSARDVVNTAGFAAQNITDGLVVPVRELPSDAQILDVRPPQLTEMDPVAGALVIPFGQLRQRLGELDKARPVATVCALGKTSYFAARVLRQHGFDAVSLAGGLKVLRGKTALPQKGAPAQPVATPAPTVVAPTADDGRAPDRVLDATGLACPGPLMRLSNELEDMAEGQLLEVRASDAGFARDVAAFCDRGGHTLLGTTKDKGIVVARLVKGAAVPAASGGAAANNPMDTTLVVFEGDMDKALGAFVIANGAAAMGGQVTMFFTFWGLNALRRPENVPVAGKTFMDNMFGWMMPRGADKLPLSRINFAGFGAKLMKWRMADKQLPSLPGMMAEAKKNGVRMVACTMSMEAMGIREEELIDGVELGGVADFLGASSQSGTNLFI